MEAILFAALNSKGFMLMAVFFSSLVVNSPCSCCAFKNICNQVMFQLNKSSSPPLCVSRSLLKIFHVMEGVNMNSNSLAFFCAQFFSVA